MSSALRCISLWEEKKLAFIGTWWNTETKADILELVRGVDAEWIGATLIDEEGNVKALQDAGFKPVAYGVRSSFKEGAPNCYIQLWRLHNPFWPKEIRKTSPTSSPLSTFCCGMYAHPGPFTPKAYWKYPQLHLGNGKPRFFKKYAFEFCPGWWGVGRIGMHP